MALVTGTTDPIRLAKGLVSDTTDDNDGDGRLGGDNGDGVNDGEERTAPIQTSPTAIPMALTMAKNMPPRPIL